MSDSMNPIADRIRAALASQSGGNSDTIPTTAGAGAPARVFDANDYAAKPWVAAIRQAVADSRKPTEDGGAPDGDYNFDDVFEGDEEADLSEFHGSSSLSSDSDFTFA